MPIYICISKMYLCVPGSAPAQSCLEQTLSPRCNAQQEPHAQTQQPFLNSLASQNRHVRLGLSLHGTSIPCALRRCFSSQHIHARAGKLSTQTRCIRERWSTSAERACVKTFRVRSVVSRQMCAARCVKTFCARRKIHASDKNVVLQRQMS